MATKSDGLSEQILKDLADKESINSYQYACTIGKNHQEVVGAIKSLESLGNVISVAQHQEETWELTEEGRHIVENGSHEVRVYNAVDPTNGILQSELMKLFPNAKVGFNKAMSNGWLRIDKTSGSGPCIHRKVTDVNDNVQQLLKDISNGDISQSSNENLKDFKKRKLISNIVVKSFVITAGPDFTTTITRQYTELTPEMIQNGTWKDKQFKSYNFAALGTPPSCGHLHPLLKVRTEIRQIFLEMGFSEMPTNNYIESSFWNFDALFQPQQHPARDAHDTFFLKDPQCSNNFPTDYLERVKNVHENGGYGSIGYRYDWKLEEAQKNILRTHTTAVSARMLYKLAQEKEFRPVKYFSIDRVFRNETLDATHLAEFHQIEGVIADYNLSLGDLIGVLYTFFNKMGIDKLRFKPAYNPYTEPSMEVFSFHSGLKKWVEIGNSGVFRPEMLLPMGLPHNVSVIAWGLSLERPTMIKYGINNIRDLVGHKINLEMVYKNPICRLDK
jgi:phenylalanyl-tRNA synthetase alpha chain